MLARIVNSVLKLLRVRDSSRRQRNERERSAFGAYASCGYRAWQSTSRSRRFVRIILRASDDQWRRDACIVFTWAWPKDTCKNEGSRQKDEARKEGNARSISLRSIGPFLARREPRFGNSRMRVVASSLHRDSLRVVYHFIGCRVTCTA